MKVRMRSFTTNEWYLVDTDKKTCTCHKGKWCKHLAELGIYPIKNWTGSATPSYSQALSGLVKSIRVRNVDEAIYWLVYLVDLEKSESGARFRLARRILIGSAEDGVSIPVMTTVSEHYPMLLSQDTDIMYLAAEVIRICKMPNWWHVDSGGIDYIHECLVADRMDRYQHHIKTGIVFKKFDAMAQYLHDGEYREANIIFNNLISLPNVPKKMICDALVKVANAQQNEQALSILSVHHTHHKSLSGDANFLGQSLVWLSGQSFEPASLEMETVKKGEVRLALEKAYEAWQQPHIIPGWCCDGMHCAGNDRRFCGMLVDMAACGEAYKYYGELSHKNKWLQEFYTTEGLVIE